MAALTAEKRDIQRLYLNIAEKGEKKTNPKISQIYDLAVKAGVKTKYMHRAKLSKFCGGRLHQNVVLKTSKLDY